MVPLTCGLFEEQLMADPTLEEEDIFTTITVVRACGTGEICAVHKPAGAFSATSDQLRCCMDAATLRAKEIEALLGCIGRK